MREDVFETLIVIWFFGFCFAYFGGDWSVAQSFFWPLELWQQWRNGK